MTIFYQSFIINEPADQRKKIDEKRQKVRERRQKEDKKMKTNQKNGG